MSAAGVMDGMPPGFVSPAAFWFFRPAATGAQAIPIPAPPASLVFPPGLQGPGAFAFLPQSPSTFTQGQQMTAPAGTLAYRTYVTLSAAGNSNGDATTISNAFNGNVFPRISGTAATASTSGAVVTIYWPDSSILVARELVRDAVAQECVALASTLNAAVTNIQGFTEINMV